MRKTLVSVLVASSVMSGLTSFAQDVESTLDTAEPIVQQQSVAALETLSDAINSAYLKNPSILAQRKSRMIADEQLKQARSANRPQVSLSTSAGYSLSRSNTGPFGQVGPTNTTEAPQTTFGLEVRQSLWNGGRTQAAIGEAKAGVTAAESRLFAAEQDMILNVVTNYMDVLASESEVDIRKNNVSVLARQVEAATDRFRVGEVTKTDVAQAEARYAGARAQLSSSQAVLEANRAVFQQLIGHWPTQLETSSFTPEYPADLQDAVDAAIEYNPEIALSKAGIKASEYRVRAAKGERRPDISIVGSAGLSQSYDDKTFENENASVVAQLRLPLYQGGRISSQIRAASLERDQLRLQHRATERDLIARVTRAWHSSLAASRAIEASEQQVEAAQVAFDGAEQELAVGLRTTLDLLDQEQELLDAKLSLIQANRDHYIAVHQLLAAMGALTPETLGVNVSL